MEQSETPKIIDISHDINHIIKVAKEGNIIQKGLINDGYHTFDELYEFRKLYNAALFNAWSEPRVIGSNIDYNPRFDVHKSWYHNDGELAFGGGWFIVVAVLPTGQISNHYKAKDWDMFKIPEFDKAKYEYDGHDAIDVIERLETLLK